jgi:hypothetical protein
MKVITTRVKGWQKVVWEWAKAGDNFELDGLSPRHVHFLRELCAAYHYKFKLLGNRMRFVLGSK